MALPVAAGGGLFAKLGGMGGLGTLLGGVGMLGETLFGGGDGEAPEKLISYPIWSAIFDEMSRQKDVAGGRTAQTYGQSMGAIDRALAGQMGLSPAMMRMMSDRFNRSLDPSFAMGRDELRRSFNPRLAGSGAAGASMGQLLGQQAQARSSGQADIQIQDLFARHQGRMAGLQGIQGMYGMSQSALMNLLAQMAGHARTQTAGMHGRI